MKTGSSPRFRPTSRSASKRSAWRRWPGLLILALLTVACGSDRDSVFDTVGVTRLYLVPPTLTVQSIFEPEEQLQVSSWRVERADLTVEGVEGTLDLLADAACRIVDTVALVDPDGEGPCGGGIVVPEVMEPVTIGLSLRLRMALHRAGPVDPALTPVTDFDSDGFEDKGDTCPLIPNPDQRNVCFVLFETDGNPLVLRDSDADRVIDPLDNCVWVANPDQEDTMGFGGQGIADFIGDACSEEFSQVYFDNDLTLDIELPSFDGFTQPVEGTSYITVDFSETALNCNWQAGRCDLDPDGITLCSYTSATDARRGCGE